MNLVLINNDQVYFQLHSTKTFIYITLGYIHYIHVYDSTLTIPVLPSR